MPRIAINLKDGTVSGNGQQTTIVGIDLGTTNSLVAYMEEGRPTTIENESGKSALVPSVIHFREDGGVLVGENAKKHLIDLPERTIYSVKRLLGKSYADIQEYEKQLAYRIIDNGEESLVRIAAGDKHYTPIGLSAEILKVLKAMAEKELARTIDKAVITVPAYFNDSQRQATRDAGKLAGLDVMRIVNEPTAASLAYGLGDRLGQELKVAVYDLGGGTFDISVLSIQNGIFEVLATNGDSFLGGDDFDRAIVDYWSSSGQINGDDLIDLQMRQEIRLLAEEAKKVLSSKTHFSGRIQNKKIELSRAEFNRSIEMLVEKTIHLTSRCLEDASLKTDDIDRVILVGGSTRSPLVRQQVEAFFGKKAEEGIDPDKVVALGAAVQADILAGNRKDMLLLDITPLSLGIETIGGLMDTLIARNSTVPVRASRQYTTSVDGQTKLKISVYQGERDLVSDNRKLGEFILHGIPPMAAGIPKIEIQFIIDADGILRVKARELRSDISTEVQIKSQYGLSEEEMALMLLDSIRHAEEDRVQRNLVEATNEANNIILHSQRFLQQNKDWLEPKDQDQLIQLVKDLREAIGTNSPDEIQSAMDRLNDFSRPLAEEAMDYNIKKALAGKRI